MVLNQVCVNPVKRCTQAGPSLILLSSLRLVRLNGVASVPLNSLKFVEGGGGEAVGRAGSCWPQRTSGVSCVDASVHAACVSTRPSVLTTSR